MRIFKSLLSITVLLMIGFASSEAVCSEYFAPISCIMSETDAKPTHNCELEYTTNSSVCYSEEETLCIDESTDECTESTSSKVVCLKGIRPAKKVRCVPGERKVRVRHDYCKGTGYVLNHNVKCGTCYGAGVVRTEDGCTPCYICCGDGRKVDKMCRGKGWIWQCVSQR